MPEEMVAHEHDNTYSQLGCTIIWDLALLIKFDLVFCDNR